MNSTPSSSERACRLLAAVSLAIVGACSDGLSSPEGGGDWWPGTDSGGEADAGSDSGWSNDEDAGPDVEIELVDPAVTDDYVFIGLASQGAVVRIGIEGGLPRLVTTRLGFVPSAVVSLGAGNRVVALSSDGARVAFVDAVVGGASDQVETLAGMAGANRLTVAPSGDWVLAWHDAARAVSSSLPRPLGDIVAIDVRDDSTYQLSTGLYVRDVVFSSDFETAFVVTDEGVSRVDLGSLEDDGYYMPIAVADDVQLGVEREMVLLGDGAFAVARANDSTSLSITRLSDGERVSIELGGAPSDLERVDAAQRVAFALPSRSAVRVVDPAEVFEEGSGAFAEVVLEFEPSSIEVSRDGEVIMAWADPAEDRSELVVFGVDDLEARTIEVRKPVVAAAFAPDGAAAVLFHSREEGSVSAGDPPDVIVARSWAYSIVRLDDAATKLVLTQSAPQGVAFDETAAHALILLPDTGRGAVDWARLRTFETTTVSFAYPPEFAGTIPGTGTAFVVQEHPRGRIAFVTLATARIQEITGFELNALIE